MSPASGLFTFLTVAALLHLSSSQQVLQPEPYLLFANSIDIRRLNFDGTNYQTIVDGLQNVVALDYDYATGYIYWSDHISKKIQRTKLDDPSNIEDFVTANLTQPDGIALDWVGRKLFFSDSARGVIEKIDLDFVNAQGQRLRQLHVGNNVHKPRGLCVDPHSDWLYFTDVFEVYPTIQKARISDGSQQMTLVSTGLAKPNAITIDYIERMLYWADAETDQVERCDLDGNNRQMLVDNPQRFHPYGLSQYEDRLYWTDQNLHHIVNVNKNTGDDKVVITGYFTYPTAIHVVHPDRQLGADIDSCQANNGRGECDDICIDMYGAYRCLCRYGYTLLNDEHSCEDTNECSIGNGGCSHHCINTEGSFHCTCISGYTLQADGRTCIDTNECHFSNGGCQFSCQNTESSYFCSCPSGYSLNTDRITCYDINECLDAASPCPAEAECRNVPGAFQCRCPTGYEYSAVTGLCEDTNECTSAGNPCSQRCVNAPGSFSCGCNEGFQIQDDGITCVDINECGESNECEGDCTNVQGSYVCSCTLGYILNPDKKSCRPAVCSQPPDITGFSLECASGYHYLSRCDVSCNYGTLVGSNYITCLSNSQWSVLTAECIGAPPKTENEPPILTYLTSNVIAEDADHGEIVGYLRSIDSDITQTFTYYLRGDAGPFYIGTDSTLRARGGLDFEAQSHYTISILATDNGIPQQSRISDLSIYLIDVNEPPGPPMWTENSISENAQVGDVVSRLTAIDPDIGQQLNFTLITNSGGKFSIAGAAIIVNRPLDHESDAVHQVHIQVRDNGSPILTNSAVFEIVVLDENEPPTKINFIHSDINEYSIGGDTLTGKIIGQFETEDPDQGDTHIYSILNNNNCFAVQGQNLVVNNAECFDFETHPFYLLDIQAMDSGGLTTRTTVRVNLADVNEPPVRVSLSTSTVTEHVPINTVIGTLSAIDPDAGDTHTFSMVNSDSPFYIDGHSVKVGADISFESYPSGIPLEVECLDSAGNRKVEAMTVMVLNENEAPNDISVAVFKPCSPGHVGPSHIAIDACIPETTVAGDTIALVESSDPDGDDLVITMIDSSDRFILTDDKKIIMGNDGVNYEATSYGHIYQVTLTATDPNGLLTEKDLTFEITDVNDIPTGVRTSSTVVSSATPVGQNFASLICMDEDLTDAHTFTLVDNSGGRFAISGNHLQVAAPLDRDRTHTRTVIVRCSDGQADSENIQIDLQVIASSGSDDIVVILDGDTIEENSPVSTRVGQISASSTDPDDSFEFDLLNSGEGVFVAQIVNSNTMNLLTNQVLDYEDDATYTIAVQVTGNYGMVVEPFTIHVTDVKEAPYNLALHNSVVQENINNALVGIVTAEDPEGDAIDFEITQDDTNSFQLLTTGMPNTKRLVTKRALDYESEQLINVAIRAREQSTPERRTSDAIFFAIRVMDVNEPPSAITLNMNLVAENAAPGTAVSFIMVTDPDSGHHLQHFTCTLKDDANGLLALDGLSIVVAPDAVIDMEGSSGNILSVGIECQDQYGLKTEDRFNIAVSDVNEQPTDILSATGFFQVRENSPGDIVAQLLTEDPDKSPQESFTYTVSPQDYFAVISDQLITHKALNYEANTTHVVNLTTTDEGGLSLTKVITIEVIDTNDPPTGIAIPTGTAIDEHSPTDTLVAELSTIDEDVDQLYSYTLEAQSPLNALKLVDGNKLKVDDGNVINHEKVKSINVTLISRDNGVPNSLFVVQSLIITVLNVNEPPRSITLASDTVKENSPDGTLVGEIYVDDPDSINQAFQCTLAVDDGYRFELDHNGTTIRLLVGNGFAFDYESTRYHDIVVQCHDSDHQSPVTGSFRVHVLNGNDPPSGVFLIDAAVNDTTLNPNRPDEDDDLFGNVITSSVVTVQESATAGTTIVAYVFVTDEDNQNENQQRQEHFCDLISEADYHRFLQENSRVRRQSNDMNQYSEEIPTEFMIQTGTNSILVREELNFEEKNEYMVYLECVDNGNPPMSTVNSVKIVVLDVDEAPIDIGLSAQSMVENSPEDSHVADIGLVDPDGTQTAYAYEIVSLGVPFYIRDEELRVSRFPIDHEETPIWTIQIRVREVNTDLAIVKNFDIVIQPQNEAPDSLTINGEVTVNIIETLPVGSEVGTLETHDPDEGDTEFSYSFHGDSASFEYFEINDDKLVLARPLDAWEMDVHQLMIQVADAGGLTYVGKITVTLTEINQCRENNYCSDYAQCIHNICTCKPGFVGNGFTCEDVDDCDPNPCDPDNSVECQNGFGGIQNFTCTCKEGWLGPYCHIQVDDCVNNTCDSTGTDQCVDKLNGHDCDCRRGYTGQYCEIDIDECAENRCQNGGLCVDGVNGYICQCVEPFIGVNCETDATTCIDVVCPHNGTCLPYPSSSRYACRCLEPFSPDCEGCMYGYGGPNCEPCQPPLTGVNCEVDGSVCTPNPCFGGGICVPYRGGKYTCICAGNFTGPHCEFINGVNVGATTQDDDDKFPMELVYIIIAVVAFLVLVVILVCALVTKRRRVLAQKRQSSHAKIRYDPNRQKVEMGPEFQDMQEDQRGGEIHDLENPTFFDFEEMVSQERAQEQEEQARAQMASIANRPIHNPKNNIVSVKVTNDLRAEFNNQGARPRLAVETEQRPRTVTDGQTLQFVSSKNNLGNYETREMDLDEGAEDDLKKDLVVDLPGNAVAFQNPSYDHAEPALGGVPQRQPEDEGAAENAEKKSKRKTNLSVKELAKRFQKPSGVLTTEELTKDNPVYDSDDRDSDSDDDRR